jgi:hypothetical protein
VSGGLWALENDMTRLRSKGEGEGEGGLGKGDELRHPLHHIFNDVALIPDTEYTRITCVTPIRVALMSVCNLVSTLLDSHSCNVITTTDKIQTYTLH